MLNRNEKEYFISGSPMQNSQRNDHAETFPKGTTVLVPPPLETCSTCRLSITNGVSQHSQSSRDTAIPAMSRVLTMRGDTNCGAVTAPEIPPAPSTNGPHAASYDVNFSCLTARTLTRSCWN